MTGFCSLTGSDQGWEEGGESGLGAVWETRGGRGGPSEPHQQPFRERARTQMRERQSGNPLDCFLAPMILFLPDYEIRSFLAHLGWIIKSMRETKLKR